MLRGEFARRIECASEVVIGELQLLRIDVEEVRE